MESTALDARLSVRVNAADASELQSFADNYCMTISEILREYINAGLKSERQLFHSIKSDEAQIAAEHYSYLAFESEYEAIYQDYLADRAAHPIHEAAQ